MAMYALAISPIKKLNKHHSQAKKVWYADYASAAGSCKSLRKWWDGINSHGPKYGYFPKAPNLT